MLWHIVRFAYSADTSDDDRSAHEADVAGLIDHVPGVRFVRVGRDVDHPEVTGVVIGLDDVAALEAYRDHPAHVPVADRGRELSDSITRIDFLTDDPTDAVPPTA